MLLGYGDHFTAYEPIYDGTESLLESTEDVVIWDFIPEYLDFLPDPEGDYYDLELEYSEALSAYLDLC